MIYKRNGCTILFATHYGIHSVYSINNTHLLTFREPFNVASSLVRELLRDIQLSPRPCPQTENPDWLNGDTQLAQHKRTRQGPMVLVSFFMLLPCSLQEAWAILIRAAVTGDCYTCREFITTNTHQCSFDQLCSCHTSHILEGENLHFLHFTTFIICQITFCQLSPVCFRV